MSEITNSFLLTFAALFPIVNPLEAAPFFLAITRRCTEAEREMLARKVAVNGFALLLGSLVLGPYLLKLFGIEIPILRIAGGLVVAAMGWKLLVHDNTWSTAAAERPEMQPPLEAFYPLTMPLTVGPGSISVAITIGSRKSEVPLPWSTLLENWLGTLAGVLAIALSIYLSYRFASNVARLIGKGGVDVLVRLSAFILVCIGLQIVWSGYSALTNPLPN
jgi:multiple antibiotic resistance protein